MRDWASLERGLLRDVFTRLPDDVDAVSFRHVCHHWRVAAGAGALVPRPWFVLLPPVLVDGTHSYLQPARRHDRSRVRAVHMEDVAVKEERSAVPAYTRGASRGWLAVNEGKRLLLRDPISGAQVPLPAMDDPAFELSSIFLSDDPLAVPDGFRVFAFFIRTDDCSYFGHLLAFYSPGDAEWRQIDPDDGQPGLLRSYRALEFFQGRTYVLLYNYRVAICDLDAEKLIMSPVAQVDYPGYDETYLQECLVECGGDLLFVQVRRSFMTPARKHCCMGSSHGIQFSGRVIKIELDADGIPVRWSDVEGIRDYALFLAAHSHAFALPASRFPAVKAGCIYHFRIDKMKVTEMVVTDLQQHSQRHEKVRKLPLDGPRRPLSWFCPRRPILDPARKHK